MSTAVRQLPAHGTLSRRKTYRCDCEPCLARDRDYTNARARLIAYGRWQPFVDAEPTRQHVRMLMTFGIGWQRTARMAGVSNGGVSRLLYGTYGRGYGPTKRVRTETADKLCSVKPAFDNLAPSARLDGTGTGRRLRALVAVGWPQMRLATEMGADKALVWQQIRGAAVEAATARAVRDAYDRLWNVDPATRGVHPRYSGQARRIAARHGWPPPGAWDDDYIDSPAAEPDLGEDIDRYTAIAEDATWLIDTHGYTRKQAAHRLGITSRHLERALSHAGTKAAV
ncbi:hypothetical protein [Streptomyces scopuliridis]|uniref:hypothetical protein n=1 Tax=Streptomyces scopuliridis TaxID=452529 RepID=UPI0036CF841D